MEVYAACLFSGQLIAQFLVYEVVVVLLVGHVDLVEAVVAVHGLMHVDVFVECLEFVLICLFVYKHLSWVDRGCLPISNGVESNLYFNLK